MIAFEVSINGEKKVLAGIEDWALLNTIIIANRHEEDGEKDELYLSVGGLALPNAEGHSEHVRWPNLPLSVNDTITLKLREVDQADAPRKRFRSDAAVQEDPFTEEEILEMEKADYLRLKAKFEGDQES